MSEEKFPSKRLGEDVMENVNKFNSYMKATTIKKQTDLKRSNCPSVSTKQISSYFVQPDDSIKLSSLNSQGDSFCYGEHSDESISLSSVKSESNINQLEPEDCFLIL